MTTQEVLHPATLRDQQIHLWRISLERWSATSDDMTGILSAEERQRAKRYRSTTDRERFVLQRGLLKQVLANYLSCQPKDICFQYSSRGRPSLAAPHHQALLDFNVTHSRDLALFAIGKIDGIGVDIEFVREDVDMRSIAKRYFTAKEIAFLENTPKKARQQIFFKMWACKEAYVKGLGEGLRLPLNTFETLPTSDDQIIVPPLENDVGGVPWKISLLTAHPEYAAAIAAPTIDWQWTVYDLTPTSRQK